MTPPCWILLHLPEICVQLYRSLVLAGLANITNCVLYFAELSREVRMPLFSSVQALNDPFSEAHIQIDVSSLILKFPHSSCIKMQLMRKMLIIFLTAFLSWFITSLSIMLLTRLMLNLHEAAAVGMSMEELNTIELETLRFATVVDNGA
ncbi:hypothetical protein C8J57DRAFT_1514795 [Mycena rebaudengoi]|nr:hypothetical protein C8J57DRAFT_1514795 [Mycena rebaudengoi]